MHDVYCCQFQMQVQLSQLQQKLAKEEEDKETVSKENQELKQTSEEREKVTLEIHFPSFTFTVILL